MIDLAKLSATPVARREEQRFCDLPDEHHYLGAGPKIGETIWYAADDGSGASVSRIRVLSPRPGSRGFGRTPRKRWPR